MGEVPRSFFFRSDDIPKPDRVAATREAFGRGVMNLDFKPLTEDPRLQFRVDLLPGLTITRGWNTPHLAVSGYDKSLGSDELALVWGTAPGKGTMSQLGKQIGGDDGTAVLITCEAPVTAETGSDFYHLTVRMERSLLLPLLPQAEAKLMLPVRPDIEALRLLTSYATMIEEFESLENGDAKRLVALHICDLVALALGTTPDEFAVAESRGLRQARLISIKRWALRRLASPELNVAAAARYANVTPRYVQQLFRDEGSTFTDFVRSMRLAWARRRLSNPAYCEVPIGTIAFDCGFGDLSYFNRAFRAAFHETPSDVRQRKKST